MKNIILLACVLLFAGCGAKYPETANLNLLVPDQSATVYSNSTVYVNGQDVRESPEVIIYKLKKEPVVKVPNINSPLVVVTERLTGGLREQGLQFETNSPARIMLKLNQLLVTVTKTKALYNIEGVSQITLKVTKGNDSLTKRYNRQNDRKSVSRPKISEIENMLNEQLSDIVTEILSDTEIQELIANKQQ